MIIKGDVNGDGRITIEDMLLVSAHMVELIELQGNQFVAADVNNDNEISVSDLAGINLMRSGKVVINEVIY